MEETNKQISEDWRAEVSDSASATLKILDGETKKVIFLDEGKKNVHADFGTSIVFKVEHESEEMNFYIKENNFSLLKQIKELGTLVGKVTEISRVGKQKSDTRYTIVAIEQPVVPNENPN